MPNTALLSYTLWEQRGRPDHDDWADWFQAERMMAEGYYTCSKCHNCVAGTKDDPVSFQEVETSTVYHGCKYCERFIKAVEEDEFKNVHQTTWDQLLKTAKKLGYLGEHDNIRKESKRRDAIEEFIVTGMHKEHRKNGNILGRGRELKPLCGSCSSLLKALWTCPETPACPPTANV